MHIRVFFMYCVVRDTWEFIYLQSEISVEISTELPRWFVSAQSAYSDCTKTKRALCSSEGSALLRYMSVKPELGPAITDLLASGILSGLSDPGCFLLHLGLLYIIDRYRDTAGSHLFKREIQLFCTTR